MDKLSPEALAQVPEDKFCTAVVDRIVSGGPLPASAEKPHAAMFRVLEAVKAELPALLLAVRDATLQAERDRLLSLTPEEVVEEAVAVCLGYTKPPRCNDVAENHGPHNCGDCYRLWSWDNDADVVRAALPILLAPEVAKREAAEWNAVKSAGRQVAAEAARDRLKGALEKIRANTNKGDYAVYRDQLLTDIAAALGGTNGK